MYERGSYKQMDEGNQDRRVNNRLKLLRGDDEGVKDRLTSERRGNCEVTLQVNTAEGCRGRAMFGVGTGEECRTSVHLLWVRYNR